jgi:hypothetical protein
MINNNLFKTSPNFRPFKFCENLISFSKKDCNHTILDIELHENKTDFILKEKGGIYHAQRE